METLVLAWIVTYLLHSTILVLGAWLLERRWADRPERMSGVWKTALVGGLLTASLQIGLGVTPAAGQWALDSSSVPPSGRGPAAGTAALPVPAVALVPAATTSEVPVLASWPPPESARLLAPMDPPAAVLAPVEPATAERHEPAPVPAVLASTTEPEPTAEGSSLRRGLLGVLGLGALLGLLSVLSAYVALRRELRGRRALHEGSLPALLEALRRRAARVRPVPLTEAPRVQVPMAIGVARPEIVVPPRIAAELSEAHQESLLAHELAHVLRRDPAWRLLALCIERVLFFQPLNRLASRRLSQAAEYLCDDWAARHTRRPLALASCLTEIATWVASPAPVAATMAGPRSILGRRVQRLLRPATEQGRPRWLAVALVLPLLAVVLIAPGASTQARAGQDERATIVFVDEHGRRHELQAGEGEVVVIGEDGEPEVVGRDDERPAASRRAARRDERAQARANDRARRQARKELRKAFREASRRGEPVPSDREVQAILDRAAPDRSQASARDGHLRLHLVVPGQLEVHGELPMEQLEALEGLELEGLEGLEMLEGLEELQELEQELGPVLEMLEGLEGGDLDLVLRHEDGETSVHGMRGGEPSRARRRWAPRAPTPPTPPLDTEARQRQQQAQARLHAALRRKAEAEARLQREHAREALTRRQQEHERARERARQQAAHELERHREEAEHDRLRWEQEQERDARQRLRQTERELERTRRRLEHQPPRWPEGTAPAVPSVPDAPYVLRRVPAPPAPPAAVAPTAPTLRVRTAPAAVARVPSPPPSPEAPVVWVSHPG